MNCILDSGAYQTISPGYAKAMYYKLARVYDIKNLSFEAKAVCTNLPVSLVVTGDGVHQKAP